MKGVLFLKKALSGVPERAKKTPKNQIFMRS